MNNTYSIKDLISLILSKIWMIIAVTLCGGIAAFCVSKFALPLEYSSHISMYVQSYTNVLDDSNNNYNDISKSKQLINTYVEVLKDDAVMESVGNALIKHFDEYVISKSFSVADGKIKPSSLATSISIKTVNDTSAINITVTTKNAELSAAVCNELCKQANQFTTKAIGIGEIKSIDTAKVYDTPVAPNVTKNTAIGGLASLMLIVLIILVLDFFDNTIKLSEDLEKKYEKPILGEIEEMKDSSDNRKLSKKANKNFQKKPAMLGNNVSFNVIESYKSMRTNILFSLSTSESKAFVISSANPDEGKSTTAVNIAITLAQGNYKVLLCDGDLRKPVQANVFGLKNKIGLSSVLSKMSEIDEAIQSTNIENLDILTSGEIPPNPSELLGSERMRDIINQLSEHYDYIIIDTPPVNVVSDALNLSQFVAGIMVVVKYASTTFYDIGNVISKIRLANMKHLGFIINDIKVKHKSGYYNKYIEYGYDSTKIKNEETE